MKNVVSPESLRPGLRRMFTSRPAPMLGVHGWHFNRGGLSKRSWIRISQLRNPCPGFAALGHDGILQCSILSDSQRPSHGLFTLACFDFADVLFRILVELLLTAGCAKKVHASLVLRFSGCLLLIHLHLTNGIDMARHDLLLLKLDAVYHPRRQTDFPAKKRVDSYNYQSTPQGRGSR